MDAERTTVVPPNADAGAAARAARTLAIVVPTRDEAANVEPLVRAIRAVPELADAEIVFVDDSRDETPLRVEEAAALDGDIRLLHREPVDQVGGLGGAVLAGLRSTDADWICVMDGDLQHPPAVIPRLLERARVTGADLVLASRFAGTRPTVMAPARRAASRVLVALTRAMFPRRLAGVTDPLTGFFVVRRGAVDLEALRPSGFKILLEIIIRSPRARIAEVGFEFLARNAGESKASLRELRRYVLLLARLRADRRSRRFAAFAAVGASGLLVNTLLLALLAHDVGLYYLLAAAIATQGSTAWNFALSELVVFGEGERRYSRARRAGLFFLMNNVALALRGPLLFVLTSIFGVYYLLSNVLSLAALTVLRFLLADTVIWSARRRREDWFYNLHDLVTIRSDVRLPELDYFRVPSVPAVTIDVSIGRVGGRPGGSDSITYDEGLGPFGFGVEIERGADVRVRATRLLQASPHVLYTNVVEPILRWQFVERGYALVHGGCIAYGERGIIVTARTDTGKTTTLLRTMAGGTCAFLSDDLTLVTAEGRLLPYPKPLTISRHTVSAIDTARLHRGERVALILQSRVHSRSGRLFAQVIARTGLPAATINAVVQLLVPPPKYHVNRLVPHAEVAGHAQLAGMVVIQREGAGRRRLEGTAATTTLLGNSADAFGFPPYGALEHFLRRGADGDLAPAEEAIVAAALAGIPADVLEDERREWWRALPAVVAEATGLELADLSLAVRADTARSVV